MIVAGDDKNKKLIKKAPCFKMKNLGKLKYFLHG